MDVNLYLSIINFTNKRVYSGVSLLVLVIPLIFKAFLE